MNRDEQVQEIREIDVEDAPGFEIGEERQHAVKPPTGWYAAGRCPVDANMVHVLPLFGTSVSEALRVEVVKGATPLAGTLVTPVEYPADQTVDRAHGCGVPATRVGPGEAPLAVDG